MAGAQRDGRLQKGLRKVKIAAVSALVVVLVIVLFQNDQPDSVHVLFWEAQISRSLLVLAVFAAGSIAGLLAAHLLWGRR
jgi:uncharacterized integral membrane protein